MLLIIQQQQQLFMHTIFQLVLRRQPDMVFILKLKTVGKKFKVLLVLKRHQQLEKHM